MFYGKKDIVSEGYVSDKLFRIIISGFPPLLIYAEPPIVMIKFFAQRTSLWLGTYMPGYFFADS
jgi:hypothetical protein